MKQKKTKTFLLRLSPDTKKKILYESARRNVKETEFIQQAIDFYFAFGRESLKNLDQLSAKLQVPQGTIAANLLQTYTGRDAGLFRVFGIHKTWDQAFRFDPKKGLISGDELFSLNQDEAFRAASELKSQMVEDKKSGKKMVVTPEAFNLLSAAL